MLITNSELTKNSKRVGNILHHCLGWYWIIAEPINSDSLRVVPLVLHWVLIGVLIKFWLKLKYTLLNLYWTPHRWFYRKFIYPRFK